MIKVYNFFIKFVSFFIFSHSKRKAFRDRFKKKKTKNTVETNNKIICITNGIEKYVEPTYFKGLKIQLGGDNNTIRIYEPYFFDDCSIIISGQNNLFELKGTKYTFHKTSFSMPFSMNNRKILIEEDCYIGGAILFNNLDDCILKIGKDCMFSAGIHIRTDDGHVICQKGTKRVINRGGNVIIGNHVWICRNVFINKNVSIGDNCIVASGALLVKTTDDTNVIWGGIPAKIIKRDIDWYRDTYSEFISKYEEK